MEVTRRFQESRDRGPVFGAVSLVMGLLACAGVTAIWAVSTTSFDMPGWLRIVSGWMIPVGVSGAFILGMVARMQRSGVGFSTAGIVFAVLAVIEFVVMIAVNPY